MQGDDAPPLNRGTCEGAECERCPFSTGGMPTRPVTSEYPDDPLWIIVGEGPGNFEVVQQRNFIGPSGQVVNQMLGKIGRPRVQLAVLNATLCKPTVGSDDADRTRAVEACRPRLMRELAQWPGKPIMTLGAHAMRAIIPKDVLDAIDPPDAPKAIRKAQKLRQEPKLKTERQRQKAVTKATERRLKRMLHEVERRIVKECRTKFKRHPHASYVRQEVNRVHAALQLKARKEAVLEVDLAIRERIAKRAHALANPKPKAKPKKPKLVKISDVASTLFDVDVDGTGVRPVIPGIHPAALLRGGGASIGGSHTPDMAFVNLIYDAGKVDSLARGKDIRLKLNVEYEITDPERATALFLEAYRAALAEGAVSIDLETYVDEPDRHSALMAYVAKIRVIGFATKAGSYSLAWDLLPPLCHSLLQVLLGQVECTYHNGLYDRTVLSAYGFMMGRSWFDTLLAHHAAFPGNSHKLQHVGAQFYGVTPWKSEFRNAEESPEGLAIYNAKDTGVTHALRGPLMLHIKRTKTESVYEIDKQMSTVAGHMHLAGMPVDRDINTELLNTFSKNVVESRQHVEDIARDKKLREQIWHHLAIQQARKQRKLDPSDFEARYQIRLEAMRLDPDWKWKIGSGKHIAALLLAMGVGLYKTTEGGDISTQKDVLEELTEVPVIRDILAFRENDKLLSTFIWGIYDRFDAAGTILQYGYADGNSRIHPIWNVHRISGRWASQWPVVSNVPKDKWQKLNETALIIFNAKLIDRKLAWPEKGPISLDGQFYRKNKDNSISKLVRPNLRRQIKCRPGRKLVGFDYAQIEARVIALISGDEFLCTIFAEDRDPHIECARIIWPNFDQLDPDTRKQLRENVKGIEYGTMYMAQLDTLHKTMLKAGNMIKLADLATAVNKLKGAMHGLVRWQQQAIALASRPPFEVRDFVEGRRRVWPMGQVDGPEAINSNIQPTAAAIMNRGMARMYPRLAEFTEAEPIAQIHDAAAFEVWEDEAVRFGQVCREAFETRIERDGRSIPFGIDVKIGDTWADI